MFANRCSLREFLPHIGLLCVGFFACRNRSLRVKHNQFCPTRTWFAPAVSFGLICCSAIATHAQDSPAVIIPPPMGIPSPGPATDQPYDPQPILPGGIVVPLYPSNSAFLKLERIKEAEKYKMSNTVPVQRFMEKSFFTNLTKQLGNAR